MQALLLGKCNDGFLASADDKDVGLSSGERLAIGVLDVDDVITSNMPLDVNDLTDSADVVAAGDEASVSDIVLNPVGDFVVNEAVLDAVTLFDFGMWESDGTSIVRYDVGDLVGTHSSSFNLKQLELQSHQNVRSLRFPQWA
jgi:hypothetical protein